MTNGLVSESSYNSSASHCVMIKPAYSGSLSAFCTKSLKWGGSGALRAWVLVRRSSAGQGAYSGSWQRGGDKRLGRGRSVNALTLACAQS